MESRALAQKVQLSNDVSPPNSTAVNKVRLTCADSVSAVVALTNVTTPVFLPKVARLSVSLAAKGQGTTCALLIVADSAGARPREAGTER